jgi:hypothetical protein
MHSPYYTLDSFPFSRFFRWGAARKSYARLEGMLRGDRDRHRDDARGATAAMAWFKRNRTTVGVSFFVLVVIFSVLTFSRSPAPPQARIQAAPMGDWPAHELTLLNVPNKSCEGGN